MNFWWLCCLLVLVLVPLWATFKFKSHLLFQTIPVAPAPASLPQMELPDSGLTYLPWAQPLTTISTMPNPGVQFAPGSAALPGSSLVHMPLSMSLTTMIPQLEAQGVDPQPQILDLPQRSDHQLDPEPQGQSLDEDPGVEPESQSLLDKLLEDQKDDGEEEDKDSYSSSLFIPNVWKYEYLSFCGEQYFLSQGPPLKYNLGLLQLGS